MGHQLAFHDWVIGGQEKLGLSALANSTVQHQCMLCRSVPDH